MGCDVSVELRVLGSLELRHDGHVVPIGSEKLRLLLAALAVDAEHVVSEDRLIDALWSEHPPATAHATLQKYVYRLRAILEPLTRVETRPPGYVLFLGDAPLDAHRFVAVVAEAREAASVDPSAALSLFDEAVALWRGPAWCEYADREPFRSDAARLEELRTAATEERVDLALACGRHREVVVELEPIIAAWPLHERFRVQLMLALYRSGRQVDALRAFRDFREYLIEETGLEPGRELQELEDDIIQQKRHLDLASDSPGEARNRFVPPLPAALVGDLTPIIGRGVALEWLEALWSRARADGAQAALVCGATGLGKTRLLAAFAQSVHARGAHVTYRSGGDGDVPARVDAQLNANGMLVVLDDLDAVIDADAASTVGRVAETLRDKAVLVVGACRDLPSEELGPVEARALEPFTVDDVAMALAGIAGLHDPDLAAAVLDETDGVPSLVVAVAEMLHEREVTARLDRALARARRAGSDLRDAKAEIAATALERARSARGVGERSEGECPYKGLAPFETSDAARFCGRDKLVAAILARLAVGNFVGIIGASGSGKSSLMRAGLVPALAGGALPGSQDWAVEVVTPGLDPVAMLEARRTKFTESSRRRVLVVDQFEEVFTTGREVRVQQACMDELSAIATSRANTAVVVIVRADYYGMCGAHARFARLLEESHVLVGAMSSDELRQAIVEPAEQTGCRVEGALVDLVCRDAGSEPGALPLVSTALAETWARRAGGELTVAAYELAGGVRGALARLADRAYESLGPDQRAVARRILLQLAQIGEGDDDVRRRASRDEVDAIDGASGVLDVFMAHRLVSVDGDGVEVAHEALLREWPRLRGWLEEDRDGRRLHSRLARAATEWERDGRDPALLYRGTPLAVAAEWAAGHPGELTADESRFVSASRAAHTEELRVARRSARRSRAMASSLAALLAVALVSGTVGAAQWLRARSANGRALATAHNAEIARIETIARSPSADHADLALLLAVESHRLAPGFASEGALETALANTSPGLEQIVRFESPTFYPTPSPDGRLLAYATNGDVHLLELATGHIVRTLHNDQRLAGASFDASGAQILSGSPTGVTVWDVATARPVGATIRARGTVVYGIFDPADAVDLYTVSDVGEVVRWDRHDPGHPRPIGTPFRFQPQTNLSTPPVVALDSAGRWIAVAPTNGDGSTTSVWDTQQHVLVHTFSGAPLGFAGDGRTILIGHGHAIDLRDLRTGTLVGSLPHGTANVTAASVTSLDQRLLAVLNDDDTIEVYNLSTRARVGQPITVPGYTLPTGFLPDGRLVVSNSSGASIWRPGATIAAPGVVLRDHGHQVTALFLGNARRVLTQRWDDNRATIWDTATRRPLGTLAGGRPLEDARSDGQVAAVDLGRGKIGLWDIGTERQLATIETHLGPQTASSFSPNGSLLAVTATQGPDKTVELWDVTRPRAPVLRKRLAVPGHADGVLASFSPDNRSLIVIDYPSSTVTVFDVAAGHVRWTRTLDSGLWQVGSSPDSQTLFVAVRGLTDNGVLFMNMSDGSKRSLLSVPDVFGIAYARRGRILAVNAGSGTGAMQLYDAKTLGPIGAPLPTPGTAALLLAASPDGNTIAAGTWNGYAALWDINPTHWEQMACRIAGRNLSRAEWHQYLRDQDYHRTCAQWPASR